MSCGSGATWQTDIKDCVCPQPQYVMEVDNGTGTFVKQCSQSCNPDAWPGPTKVRVDACYPCPFEGQIYDYLTVPPTCACDPNKNFVDAAGQCLLTSFANEFTSTASDFSESRAIQISYNSVETRNTGSGQWSLSLISHNSGTMQYYYLDAAVGCSEFKDVKKCQLLANLCVLQLYNQASVVCSLYRDIVKNLDTLAYPDYYVD